MEKNYDYLNRGTPSGKNWTAKYARKMYNTKQGNCYSFAAAYAYLAKTATGRPVRVCLGKTNGFSGNWQTHAWTEVKIGSKWYICDPNMDKYAANASGKYVCKKAGSKAMKKTYQRSSSIKIKLK